MKQLKTIICALCVIFGSISCADMLETDSSRQVFDPKLDAKTDSIFYALGILQGMQELADQYVFQGEMRGDLVKTTTYTDRNLRQLADFSANTSNKYDSAYVYYRVINNCNYYIAHRDTTLRTGADYVVMNEYVAIKAIRAWAYMQLARVYGKVPFYTEPLTSISQIDNNNYPELDLNGIVAQLAPDLEQYTGYPTPNYGNTVPGSSPIFASRLFIPVDIVLGDMYLETEQFDKAAQHYITYLTQVAGEGERSSGYMETYSWRGFMGGGMPDLPSDWNFGNASFATSWSSIFTGTNSIASEIITYIPMAPNSQQGATTLLPKTFGYDFYANNKGYIDEIQIQASDSYLALSDKQDYYYTSTLSTSSAPVINSAKLGDTRYNGITTTRDDTESDSVTVWITKYNTARIILYRTSTVLLHLAEAFNRLGMPDAAFAILKDGLNHYLVETDNYLSDETKEALQTTYPLFSSENISKFGDASNFIGIHAHGAGNAFDAYISGSSIVIWPGLTGYQYVPTVSAKLQEIANTYQVNVGNTDADIQNAVEDLLCDEYALEFAFEGSRFYDLCRLARHKNAAGLYGPDFGNKWLAKKLAYKNPTVNLEDQTNWYLPFK